MKKLIVLLSLAYVAAWSLTIPAYAEDTVKPLAIEQQLFNDFAARMQDHLHKTAAQLEKIRLTSDAQEREKLMKEYHHATQTTMKINHAMHMLIGGKGGMMGEGMMGGKKKMAGKGGGMGCMMMKQKSAQAAQSGDDTPDQEDASAAATEPAAGTQSGEASEHEGHH